jgi:hypothetical protein
MYMSNITNECDSDSFPSSDRLSSVRLLFTENEILLIVESIELLKLWDNISINTLTPDEFSSIIFNSSTLHALDMIYPTDIPSLIAKLKCLTPDCIRSIIEASHQFSIRDYRSEYNPRVLLAILGLLPNPPLDYSLLSNLHDLDDVETAVQKMVSYARFHTNEHWNEFIEFCITSTLRTIAIANFNKPSSDCFSSETAKCLLSASSLETVNDFIDKNISPEYRGHCSSPFLQAYFQPVFIKAVALRLL